MACRWWGREAMFLPQNLSPVMVAAVHLPQCTQPVEEGLRANGGAPSSFSSVCCWACAGSCAHCQRTQALARRASIPAAARVRSMLLLLRHERRQYCNSPKFDFAGAESCFKKSEIIFKIVASHAVEQRLGQGLYTLMTYCHWNAICLQDGEERSYLGFQTNWTWVLATSVEHSHSAWGDVVRDPCEGR